MMDTTEVAPGTLIDAAGKLSGQGLSQKGAGDGGRRDRGR